MPLTGWPAYADDDGTGTSGTAGTKAFFDEIHDAIYDYVVDEDNPTITPAELITEVVDARGSHTSLANRLAQAMDDDGNVLLPGSAITSSVAAGILRTNLVSNDLFDIWFDASYPAHFTLSGAAGTASRTGSAAYGEAALASTRRKVGRFACKHTRAGTNTYLTQELLDSGIWAVVDHFEGRTFGFGVWCWTAAANVASIILQADAGGVLVQRGQYSISEAGVQSSNAYHPGDSAWHFLCGTYTIPTTATELKVKLAVETTNADVWWAAPTVVLGNVLPMHEVMSHQIRSSFPVYIPGTLSAGATVLYQGEFARPSIVDHVRLNAMTAPTGQALIVDLETGDGAAFNSMFTAAGTRPQIAAAATRGGAKPDGTYAYRCLRGEAAAVAAGSYLRFMIDQVGSGVAGADLYIRPSIRQYANPLEAWRDFDDIG